MTCHWQALSLVSARYDVTVNHLCSSKELVNCKEKSFCIVTILTWDSFSPLSSLMNRRSPNFVFIGWCLSFCLLIGRNKNRYTYFCHHLSWIAKHNHVTNFYLFLTTNFSKYLLYMMGLLKVPCKNNVK